MVMENRIFEENESLRRDRNRASMLAAEMTRTAAAPATTARSTATPCGPAPPPRDRFPLFWEIFGGTLISVVALIVITAFSQLGSTAADLRRDLNQLQAELVRKDDLNVRLTAVWTSVKDLQGTTASRASLEEGTRALSREFSVCFKTDDDQRKDLQRQLEDLNRRVQALAERLASLEATHRLTVSSGK